MTNYKFLHLCFIIGLNDYFMFREEPPKWMVEETELKNWRDGQAYAKNICI